MSEANRELVRRAYRAFNERDVDALVAMHTEDVEYRLIGGFADVYGERFGGHAGVRRWCAEMIETLGSRATIESMHEAGDRVLAVIRLDATGGTSGANATMRFGQLCDFREGRVSAVDNYYEVPDAFEAAGLPIPEPS